MEDDIKKFVDERREARPGVWIIPETWNAMVAILSDTDLDKDYGRFRRLGMFLSGWRREAFEHGAVHGVPGSETFAEAEPDEEGRIDESYDNNDGGRDDGDQDDYDEEDDVLWVD